MTSLDIFVIGMDFQTDTNKMMATSDLCRLNKLKKFKPLNKSGLSAFTVDFVMKVMVFE